MKRYLLLVLIIIILGVIFILSQIPEGLNDKNISLDKNIKCSDEKVVFTEEFINRIKIDSISPIGALDGGSHGRSYIKVKQGGQAKIYAPTDAILEYIVYARRGPLLETGEYGLWFRVGCNLVFLLDHLDGLSEELQVLAPEEFSESSATSGSKLEYKVTAGDLIGYTDGTDLARTFDFLVLDESKQVEYINPNRFEWDQNNFSQCPYDYYENKLKTYYYSKLEQPNNTNNDCGNPSYDLKGTAAGAWFKGNDKDIDGQWLTFGTYTNYSGLAIRQDAATDFSVRDYKPTIKPEDMRPSDMVCYDYNGSWAYVKLDTKDRLSVATGVGRCPDNFPISQAEIWTR